MSHSVIRYEDLGGADFGWLHAKHHFSFGHYYDPERIQFGNIRVINDDIIEPHYGFDPHPHNNMEIITFVREGAITHKDNLGNEGRTESGNVQVMSAGTGVIHSEYNNEDELTNIYQIWVFPDKQNVKPRWETASFKNLEKNNLNLLVSGFNEDSVSLKIHQDIRIYSAQFDVSLFEFTHKTNRDVYALCSSGEFKIRGEYLKKGDAIQIQDESNILIQNLLDSGEIILIET